MSERVCVTRSWKQARGRAAAPARAAAPPAVFQGTLHLADLTFATPSGPRGVAPADLAVVQQYLGLATVPIGAYASQYGPARLALGPGRLPLAVSVGANGYRDADLQGWVNRLASDAGLGAGAAILVLNPPGVVNEDAREKGGVGVLGYHGLARVPYAFVNLLGSGFTLDDRGDLFAEATSHEVAEMTVDPLANGGEPEVCDGCGTNCQGAGAYRAYFDAQGRYLWSSPAFPPPFAYGFFISAIARPSAAADCPAPAAACDYPPPG